MSGGLYCWIIVFLLLYDGSQTISTATNSIQIPALTSKSSCVMFEFYRLTTNANAHKKIGSYFLSLCLVANLFLDCQNSLKVFHLRRKIPLMSKKEFKWAHWRRKVDILQLPDFSMSLCGLFWFCCDDFIRSDSCGQTAQHLLSGASTGVWYITLLAPRDLVLDLLYPWLRLGFSPSFLLRIRLGLKLCVRC